MDGVSIETILDQSGLFILAIILIYSGRTVITWYREDVNRILDVMIEQTQAQTKFNTLLEDVEDELQKLHNMGQNIKHEYKDTD